VETPGAQAGADGAERPAGAERSQLVRETREGGLPRGPSCSPLLPPRQKYNGVVRKTAYSGLDIRSGSWSGAQAARCTSRRRRQRVTPLLWEILDNSVDEVINGTRDRGHARQGHKT